MKLEKKITEYGDGKTDTYILHSNHTCHITLELSDMSRQVCDKLEEVDSSGVVFVTCAEYRYLEKIRNQRGILCQKCPFCGEGSEIYVYRDHPDSGSYFVECEICGANGSHRAEWVLAIESWNLLTGR